MDFLKIEDDVLINTRQIVKVSFDNDFATITTTDGDVLIVDDDRYLSEISAFVNRNRWVRRCVNPR